MTVIVKSIIERITILSPSIPVNRSIPEEINGTPNAKEVAAPPNSPNKIRYLLIYLKLISLSFQYWTTGLTNFIYWLFLYKY